MGDKKKGRGKGPAVAKPVTGTPPMVPVASGTHEWVSFPDPDEDRTWLFDVTFLLSGWRCLYGAGCPGVLTAPAPELEQGCCSYGAHFTGDEDRERVLAAARRLTAEQWQFRRRALRGGMVRSESAAQTRRGTDAGGTEAGGGSVTRIVEGACIFLNRPGFAGGAGCALHRAALEWGQRPLDLKPDVCWQLPLRREDTTDEHGHVTSTVSQWERRHWGAGGREFAWWCTEATEAFDHPAPAYRRLRAELVGMCGEAVVSMLAGYLDRMPPVGAVATGGGVPLPHPTVRPRTA